MAKPAQVRTAFLIAITWICLPGFLQYSAAQQQTLGSIEGHLRVERGGAPSQRILVDLEFRGATIATAYTDSQGMYGFHSLPPNPYRVVINDDNYQPQSRDTAVPPSTMAPTVFEDFTLVPKAPQNARETVPAKNSGANPNMTDIREYAAKFPKPAVKEFKKGVDSDQDGKKDDAIKHYAKAVEIAPDFYQAHNNLGSDYLSKSDFPSAKKQFSAAIQGNQSDSAGYFNLSNVCMLMGELTEAKNYLEEGMRRDPESALGLFLLGSLDLKTGKLTEAEQALRKAILLNRTMVQARLQLVNLLLQVGKKDSAITELHDFVTTFPDNSFSPQAKQLLKRLEASAQAGPTVH